MFRLRLGVTLAALALSPSALAQSNDAPVTAATRPLEATAAQPPGPAAPAAGEVTASGRASLTLSGYVAVVTKDDTWRAFLPREQVSTIVALMLRRPIEEVARIMAEGPGPLTPSQPS